MTTQAASADRPIKLDVLLEVSVGSPISQLRAMPVCLGEGASRAFLAVYCADEEHTLSFSVYGTLPVDLNGDGYHELVRGIPGQDGAVLDRRGNALGCVGASVAMLSKFLDHPGEQLLAYHPDGTLQVWGDRKAQDSRQALARYTHPLYAANQRLTGVGYNLPNLGGL